MPARSPFLRFRWLQVVAFAQIASVAVAQNIMVGLDPTHARALPPAFYGVNGQNRGSINWDDPGFQLALASLGPSLLRLPSGTGGNYWDWKTGTFLTNYDDGYTAASSTYPSPLSEFVTELGLTHAAPVFVLNMLTDPTAVPSAGSYVPFSTSSPNLSYQLQLLQAAQAAGMPIPYVELGNEYYLSNMPGYTTVYPDPGSNTAPPASVVYGRLASQWITAIRQKYPGIKIAAVAANNAGSGATRAGQWNAGLFDAAQNIGQSGSALQGEDAVTVHIYPASNLAAGVSVTAANAPDMLAQPFKTAAAVTSELAVVPSNVGIWVTEYNLRDQTNPTFGTWAHGLYVATLSLLLLENNQVQMAIHHGAVSNAVFADLFSTTTAFANVSPWTGPASPPSTTQWGKSATAVALGLIDVAAVGQTQAERLSFAAAPTVNAGGTSYPALYGWVFGSGASSELVIVNLSGTEQSLDLSALVTSGSFDQVSGDPGTYVTGGLRGSPTNLVERTGAMAGATAFAVPGFSITRIAMGASRLTNLSIRTGAGVGAQTLITGFVVRGTGSESLLVRAVGPTLGQYGVTGTLADPFLQVISGGTVIAQNDNWGDTDGAQLSATAAAVGAFPLPTGSKDAALLTSAGAGAFSAEVSGVGGGTGIALAELYAVNPSSDANAAHLINVSARAQVGTGADVLIAGFDITGSAPKQVLIRGVGPTLSGYGVGGVLADPQLRVFDHAQVAIAQNDNWGDNSDPTAVAAAAQAVGAFPLPSGSLDAAMLMMLTPGSYTVEVSGVSDTTGVALLEVYDFH